MGVIQRQVYVNFPARRLHQGCRRVNTEQKIDLADAQFLIAFPAILGDGLWKLVFWFRDSDLGYMNPQFNYYFSDLLNVLEANHIPRAANIPIARKHSHKGIASTWASSVPFRISR